MAAKWFNSARVINAKNCPTTFYCIFQLVWVPMTTTKNIRVCSIATITHFFHKGPPLWRKKLRINSKGDFYEKKCLIGAKETHTDILHGGHRNPFQLENAIKSGTVFCIYHQGAVLSGMVVSKKVIIMVEVWWLLPLTGNTVGQWLSTINICRVATSLTPNLKQKTNKIQSKFWKFKMFQNI